MASDRFAPNQTPEQIARDAIDAQLKAAGWAVQRKDGINFREGEGQAVREYASRSDFDEVWVFYTPFKSRMPCSPNSSSRWAS